MTALIGGAIGAVVGLGGYYAYTRVTGSTFNWKTAAIATGIGAAGGALIGTGIGLAAGVGMVSTATTVAVAETTAGVATGVETANLACGGDMCASEAQEANQLLQESAPVVENTIGQVSNDLAQAVQQVTDKTRTADQFLSDAGKFLGDKYDRIASGVYRTVDGLRQVRFTDNDLLPTHGNLGPHGHFELINALGQVFKNIHIPLIGE